MLFRLAALAVALQAAACATAPVLAPAPGARACPSDAAAEREAADVVRAFFVALAVDDLAGVRAATTDDFFAYDVGKEFTAATLVETIAGAHRSGVRLEWNLGDVRAHARCDLAWAAWINSGSVTNPGQEPKPRQWLESAVLERQDGRWRMRFLHSTPKDPRP
ncbi:MAG TPA: nuclear transport factor 2 family protein [Caulobacteraceae bacterium]|jgi:ketosteroid isomerase-like protein